MMLKYLEIDQAVQSQIDDRFCLRSQVFDPELGISSCRLFPDLHEDWVEGGIARWRMVEQEEGLHVSVDARLKRKLREYGAGNCAVQVPPGTW